MPEEDRGAQKKVKVVVSGATGEEDSDGYMPIPPGMTARGVKKKILECLAEEKGKDPNNIRPEKYELLHQDRVLAGNDDVYDRVGEQEKIRLQPDMTVASTPSLLPLFLFLYIPSILIILLIFLVKKILNTRERARGRQITPKDGNKTEESYQSRVDSDVKWESVGGESVYEDDISNPDFEVEWDHVTEESNQDDKSSILSIFEGNSGSSFFDVVSGKKEGFKEVTEHQILTKEKGWKSKENGVYQGKFRISDGKKTWFGEGEKAGEKWKLYICLPKHDYDVVKESQHGSCFNKREETTKGIWCSIHFNGAGTSGGKPKKLSSGISETERYLNKIFGEGIR